MQPPRCGTSSTLKDRICTRANTSVARTKHGRLPRTKFLLAGGGVGLQPRELSTPRRSERLPKPQNPAQGPWEFLAALFASPPARCE